MTEPSDSVDVKMSPSRPPISWRGVAMFLASMLLLLGLPLGLSIFVRESTLFVLCWVVFIPLFILLWYVRIRVSEHELEQNMRTLRISSARIEYFGRGQEILGCDRASLRVRRLRYVARVWGEVEVPPDAMAIELSGPGLRPLVIYRFDMYSSEMWKQIDEVIRRLPEFTVERRDWIKLRAALGLER